MGAERKSILNDRHYTDTHILEVMSFERDKPIFER
jgi:hypothetical protein